MRKAFFSFVTVTLVVLVLFVAASFLFSINDYHDIVQKDLEVRRVSERMADLKLGLNQTFIDAIEDAAYASYGCNFNGSRPAMPDNFCAYLSTNISRYFFNTSAAFSDVVRSNISVISFSCVNDSSLLNAGFPNQWGDALNISATRLVGVNASILVLGESSSWFDYVLLNVSVDFSNRTAVGVPLNTFGVRIRGLGTNSSFSSHTLQTGTGTCT